jgi:site-specific DNA recombinase
VGAAGAVTKTCKEVSMNPKSSTNQRKLDAIVRVSRKGDRDNLRSPEQQEADVRAWAKRSGAEIVAVHVEVDSSGKTTNRPALNRAKARALNGEVDGIAAAYLSRFSRNTVEGLLLVQELLDSGRMFVALDCPFDLDTPDGRRFLTYELANAQAERERATLAFNRGVKESIARGVHLGVPFGYRRSGGRATKLVPDEREAPVVRLAFELRADGHTWPSIATRLNEGDVMPRSGGAWTHKTVRQMVTNRVYTGTAWNGDWEKQNAHEAIVTPEVFASANRRKGTKPQGPTEGYLLSGLIRCSGCGYAMTHNVQNGRRYYRCRAAQHGDGRCPAPVNVAAEQVETWAWGEFEGRYFTPDGKARPVQSNGRVDRARKRVEEADSRYSDALDLAIGSTGSERARAQRKAKVDRAEQELVAAEGELAAAEAEAHAADLPDRLTIEEARKAPVADRRHWLAIVFAAVVVRKARVWREPAADRARIVDRVDGISPTVLRGIAAQLD